VKRLTAVVLCLLGVLVVATPAAAARPNIVLILTDDQRWDTVRYMPTVAGKLVGQGVTFANGFVTNPLCCPSRASILTGAYSHTTRVYRNDGPLGGFASFRDESTLATWLDDAGYRTALIGKYLNGYPGSYVPPGWDRWVAFRSAGYYRYGFDVGGEDFPVTDRTTYSTDFLRQEAVSFIRAAPRPFFLYFAPYAPHGPATPATRHESAFSDLLPWRPPSYDERDVSDKPRRVRSMPRLDDPARRFLDGFRRNQLRTLLAVDEAVASILEALADRGQLQNTVIVFMSDNGFLWGEHRLSGKRYPYDESIRVPFVVRYDGLVDAARTDRRSVLGIDLAPTFAELAGVEAPGAEGRSLLPLLTRDDARWRRAFLVETLKGGRPPTYCGIRAQRYKFVAYASGDRELYDLAADPHELRNLAGAPSRAKTLSLLRTRLARLCNPPPPGLSRKLLCTQVGTHGSDTLMGSERYDVVCAKDGADSIDARGGADYVFAGAGDDRIFARDGYRDAISCGFGQDVALVDATDRAWSNCDRVRRR
jgi:N-acetylglucosamine-6-sulfatase